MPQPNDTVRFKRFKIDLPVKDIKNEHLYQRFRKKRRLLLQKKEYVKHLTLSADHFKTIAPSALRWLEKFVILREH